ncbi:MAG TPA: cytochrome P460 family protein [Planctomycetaceae bacterium]|nr:cytochrome P460 family protein [Planctomycetaceae bacterium]
MPSLGNVRWTAFGVLTVASLLLFYGASRGTSDEPGSASKPAKASAVWPTAPRYNDKGDLKLPEGYETWVFVGSNLGIEYREDASKEPAKKFTDKPAGPVNFHNVYINPEAYDHYRRTGKFPENTVLVLDIYKADEGEPRSIVSEGRFPGKQVSVAVAVKNSARPDGAKTDWAYYDFSPGETAAKAFPNKACYDCHLQHADDDNVWVQFYPTLRKLRATKDKPAAKDAK